MYRKLAVLFIATIAGAVAGCHSDQQPTKTATVPDSGAPRIYVTNEVSGDMTVIDSGNRAVIATVPLGKRPRGIHASPDHKTLYVAASSSIYRIRLKIPGVYPHIR